MLLIGIRHEKERLKSIMPSSLKLLLPVIFPSWRFFDEVKPSPRIEYRVKTNEMDNFSPWSEIYTRPKSLSLFDMLKRLFWNPDWNGYLYVTSCAEMFIETDNSFYQEEIAKRILQDLKNKKSPHEMTMQFRLIFIARNNEILDEHVLFTSSSYQIGEGKN